MVGCGGERWVEVWGGFPKGCVQDCQKEFLETKGYKWDQIKILKDLNYCSNV